MNSILDISVIPQFIASCWFNSILMTSLFSEKTRIVVYDSLKEKYKSDNSSIISILKYISKNHPPIEYYNKIRAELLLFKFLKKYDIELLNFLKKVINKKNNRYDYLGYTNLYISKFFNILNVNVLDIYYDKNNNRTFMNLLDIYKKYTTEYDFDLQINYDFSLIPLKKITPTPTIPPDIIIMVHSDFDKEFKPFMKVLEDTNQFIYSNHIIPNIPGIANCENEIFFMDNLYEIDSCLIYNYNKFDILLSHSIAGITYNDNKYIYNGWNIENKELKTKKPCGLFKFDWTSKEDKDFSFNRKECKLDSINISDLCFNFNKGEKVFIYVRKNYSKKEEIILNSTSINSISNIKSIVYDFYNLNTITDEDIEKLNKNELIELLKKLKKFTGPDFYLNIENLKKKVREVIIEKLLIVVDKFNYSRDVPFISIEDLRNKLRFIVGLTFNFNEIIL